MKKILLVSHGTLAKGIFEAYKMIAGCNENIKYVCLSDGKDIEEFKVELQSLKEWMSESDNLFVLSDILGGSPYITTIQYLQDNNLIQQSQVIAGMNLTLLLTIGLGGDLQNKEEVLKVVNETKNSIQLFEYCEDDEDDDL